MGSRFDCQLLKALAAIFDDSQRRRSKADAQSAFCLHGLRLWSVSIPSEKDEITANPAARGSHNGLQSGAPIAIGEQGIHSP